MIYGYYKVAAASPEIALGDCYKNTDTIKAVIDDARREGAVLLVLPRLCVTGATCGDLFLQRRLTAAAEAAMITLAEYTADKNIVVVCGLPIIHGNRLYDCAAVLFEGGICGICPSTDAGYPFDSWHGENERHEIYGFGMEWENGIPFGSKLIFSLPEYDIVFGTETGKEMYGVFPPSAGHAAAGANVICALAAEPETAGSGEKLMTALKAQSRRLVCGYVYSCAGGGESTTDAVYPGRRVICENGGILAASDPLENRSGIVSSEIDCLMLGSERMRSGFPNTAPDGYENVDIGHIDCEDTVLTRDIPASPFNPRHEESVCREVLDIQAEGLARRLVAARAPGCVLGVSGGLDSTLALLVSVEAMKRLGREASGVTAVTMPCFGTTARTRSNAEIICQRLGVSFRCVDIKGAVDRHFEDIGHDPAKRDAVYENAQARERTQILMDIANERGDIVVGTGDLSELALGWATYNGDHMSMYGVNASVPKTLIREIVGFLAARASEDGDPELSGALRDIIDTPVSPELLPADKSGDIAQKTEDLVGPYELHDFFLYYFARFGFATEKIQHIAEYAFKGVYDTGTIGKWLDVFLKRFFAMQFKRSCMPDGPDATGISLSPRGGWKMPSDVSPRIWRE